MAKNISRIIVLLEILLILSVPSQAQNAAQFEAKLIHRFENRTEYPVNYGVTTKAVESLGKYVDAKRQEDRTAIRLCSNDSMLRAYYTAAEDPWVIWKLMVWQRGRYESPPEHTLILRSTDCPGNDPVVTPVEIWALPNGVAPPPHEESMKRCRLKFEYLAENRITYYRPHLVRRREYEVALRKLIAQLRAKPKSLGLIWGYYLRKSTSTLEHNLRGIQSFMKRHEIPKSRYIVRLNQFEGGFDPSIPEPKYPDVNLVYLVRFCKEK